MGRRIAEAEAEEPRPPASELAAMVKERAAELGFDLCGIAPADPPEHVSFFLGWLSRGFAGLMEYLARNSERRVDPSQVLPGAKSIICLATSYRSGYLEEQPPPRQAERDPQPDQQPRGVVARYAWGRDYHNVLEERLQPIVALLSQATGGLARSKAYVDTGPILERDAAMRAGLGWIGKNTNLINPRLGSWLLLSEVITDVELPPDPPMTDHCGTCHRCLDACPTDAFAAPWDLDARRCISYLTIELRGPIPQELRSSMGAHVFGCDVCQDVCPFNWNTPAPGLCDDASPSLAELLSLDDDGFRRRFRGSPVRRAKRRGLLRNAAVALGNTGGPDAVPALAAALRDPEPLVRGHAAWALGRIGGGAAIKALEEALATEEDPDARQEITEALHSLKGDRPT